MGNATAAIPAGNSMFHNIAALATHDASQISFGYDYRSYVNGINNVSLQYIYSGSFFNTGFSIFKSGDKILNEFIASIGIAQELGIAKIGVKANYHQLYSAPFGYTYATTVSAGVMADLSEEFTVGAYLTNGGIIRYKNELQKMNIPVIVSIGIAYKASANLLLALSALKDLDVPLKISSGVAYKIIENINLRTGINWFYKDFYYGIGYVVKGLKIDYALNPVSNLGEVHSLTVAYKLEKPDDK